MLVLNNSALKAKPFILQALLEKNLIPKAQDSKGSGGKESEVFYLKMKGDYFRYLAEVSQGSARDGEYQREAKGNENYFI